MSGVGREAWGAGGREQSPDRRKGTPGGTGRRSRGQEGSDKAQRAGTRLLSHWGLSKRRDAECFLCARNYCKCSTSFGVFLST